MRCREREGAAAGEPGKAVPSALPAQASAWTSLPRCHRYLLNACEPCVGLNLVLPKIHFHPEAQNAIFFGDRVFRCNRPD